MNAATHTTQLGVLKRRERLFAVHYRQVKEAIPAGDIQFIWNANPAVLGGINLRGLIVPVIDLLPGKEAPDTQGDAAVLVIEQDGKILGIYVEKVVGLFTADAETITEFTHQQSDNIDKLLSGGVWLQELNQIISVLDLSILLACDQLPHVSSLQSDAQRRDIDGGGLSYLIIGIGKYLLAIDVDMINGIVIDPELETGYRSGDYYLGDILYEGNKIPAVNFAIFSGLAESGGEPPKNALLVAFEERLVALYVHTVIDIQLLHAEEKLPLPAQSFRRPELFSGILGKQPSVQFQAAHSLDIANNAVLFIDGPALLQDPQLAGISKMYRKQAETSAIESNTESESANEASKVGETALLIQAGGPLLIPINMVDEIVSDVHPFIRSYPGAGSSGLMLLKSGPLGLFDLCDLVNSEPLFQSEQTAIIVCHFENCRLGFMIEELVDVVKYFPVSKEQAADLQSRPTFAPILNMLSLCKYQEAERRKIIYRLDLFELTRQLVCTDRPSLEDELAATQQIDTQVSHRDSDTAL